MMREVIDRSSLWAMHPGALSEFLPQQAIGGVLPEGLRMLLAGTPASAAVPKVDPIRDGSTLIVPVEGVLTPKGSYSGTGTERLIDIIDSAARDDRVGAIVLKIMSPGGLVMGTQEAGDAIFAARAVKPVIALADKYAFSAAHWLATQATAFFSTPSGQVGSVGVRAGHVDQSGFDQKIGIITTLIASDSKKIAGHPFAPLSDDDRAEIQAEIDEMNGEFVAAIARGRKMSAGAVPGVHGTGQVFSAKRAASAGVIDGIMTLPQVLAKYAAPRARTELMRQRAELQAQSIEI